MEKVQTSITKKEENKQQKNQKDENILSLKSNMISDINTAPSLALAVSSMNSLKNDPKKKKKTGFKMNKISPAYLKIKSKNHQVNMVEKILLFSLQIISLLDLIGDLIVLNGLVQTNNIGWTTFTILTMICPYLISYAPLVTYFVERSQQKLGLSKEKKSEKIIKAILVTPFCLLYIIFIDLVYTILNLTVEPLDILIRFTTCMKCEFIDIDVALDKLLSKPLHFNLMDCKGFKRLRSISQQIFESIPQIIIQLRILKYGSDNYGVSEDGIIFSVACAIVHGIFEAIVIKLEANACETSFIYYATVCLNGRFNWVPYLERFSKQGVSRKLEKIDYGNMKYKICRKDFYLDYYFSNETMRLLSEGIGDLPTNPVHLPNLILGKSCRDVSLKEINLLVFTTFHRMKINWDGVDFITKFKNELIDLKTPLFENGEYLIIFYAQFECEKALIDMVKLGADLNVKSKEGLELIKIIIEKELINAFQEILKAGVNINMAHDYAHLFKLIRQKKNLDMIKAYCLSERTQIDNCVYTSIVDVIRSFFLEGKYDEGLKILSYMPGIHTRNENFHFISYLVKNGAYSRSLQFYLEFQNKLSPFIFIQINPRETVEIPSEIAERFKMLRILSNGSAIGNFSEEASIGSQSNPYDFSYINCSLRHFEMTIHMIKGKLPDKITKADLIACDQIVDSLLMDHDYPTYLETASSIRSIKTVEFQLQEVTISHNCKTKLPSTEVGNPMSMSVAYIELPEEALAIQEFDLEGNFCDQGWGNTGHSRLTFSYNARGGARNYCRLFYINRDNNKAYPYVRHRIIQKDQPSHDLFSFRANGLKGNLYAVTEEWSGWECSCRDGTLKIKYFEKEA